MVAAVLVSKSGRASVCTILKDNLLSAETGVVREKDGKVTVEQPPFI